VVRRRRIDNTWPVATLTAGSEARYRLRIAISAYHTCIRRIRYGGFRRNIAMPFGVERLEWCGYPMVKTFRRYVLIECTNVTDTQTDTQTPHDSIGRVYKASRGNKISEYLD